MIDDVLDAIPWQGKAGIGTFIVALMIIALAAWYVYSSIQTCKEVCPLDYKVRETICYCETEKGTWEIGHID